MNRTRKIILTPSTKPLRLLKQHADYRRDAHNWTLRDYKDKCAAEEPHPTSMLLPVWQGERASAYPQSTQLCRSAGQHAVYALENAIKAGEDKTRHNKAPRFHGQDHKIAFRADKRAVKVQCDKKRIELPNIGKVRMLESLNPEEPISTVTVTYEDERWWACVEVEMKNPPASPGTEIIGVDVGVGTIAVCSDGTRYEIPEALKSLRREIGRLTRRLARQVEGSGHHERVQRQLQKARYLARCWREEAQHKAANEIVAKARMVVVESLDVRDMMNPERQASGGGNRQGCHERPAVQDPIPVRGCGGRVRQGAGEFPQHPEVQQVRRTAGHAAQQARLRMSLLRPGHGPRRQRRPQLAALWRNVEPVRRVVAACCSRAALRRQRLPPGWRPVKRQREPRPTACHRRGRLR